ncbi:MAG: hypothetical protein ACMUEM_06130 [Flavobacteriales bacterium AspAUS03]
MALLLVLKISSDHGTEKLIQIIGDFFSKNQQLGLPSLCPVITKQDPIYNALLINHYS